MFETNVMGLFPQPIASASGDPVLRSPANQGGKEPSHAASRALGATPASSQASLTDSMSRSEKPVSKRSPNFVQPTPTMATLSFKLCIVTLPQKRSQSLA